MIKVYLSLLLSFFVLFSNVSLAQKTDNYKKSWAKIDSLKKKRLPKSVYSEANKIYLKAKGNKDHLEVIKALSVKYSYADRIIPKGKLNLLKLLDGELKGMEFPYNAIMHSFIADKFFDYFKSNGYKIKRIDITEDNNDNIEKWDKKDYIEKIDYHFQQSIKGKKEFRKLKTEDYNRIFVVDSLMPEDLNLYELLARNALDFYFTSDWSMRDYHFVLSDKNLFKPAKEYAFIDLSAYNPEELQYKGLKVLQDLMNFILRTRSKEALVRNELYRFKLLYKKFIQGERNHLYIKALEYLEKHFHNNEVARVYFDHASFLVDNSINVMGCKGEEKNYNYRKNAKALCEKCIDKYGDTKAAKYSKKLIEYIKKKNVDLTCEMVVPSKKTFPILMKYGNTEKVWVRVWKLKSDIDIFKYIYNDKYKLTRKSVLIRTTEFSLKGGNDLNKHSTELLLKGLDYGKYLIEVSAQKNYPSKKYSIGILSVSDIQFMRRSRGNISEIRVLDRNNGKPIDKAKIVYWHTKWSRGEYQKSAKTTLYTDKNGLASIKANNRRIDFVIYKGKDSVSSGSMYSYRNYNRDKRPTIKIFTDRKIYRPGEKVYFKALLYKSDNEDYTVLKDKKIKFDIRGPRFNEVANQELVTNEFGSVSGSFTLPFNALTGGYSILTKNGGHHRIRVEEYKVPKFEIKPDKLKKEYKYNDNITVKAQALTFNNVAVSDAKFEYKVYRKEYNIIRPYLSYWGRGELILSGKGTTDKEGKLNFNFVAKPSKAIEDNMVSSYTYEVAVTDINGETQKLSGRFRISSQSLFIKTDINRILSYNDLKKGIEFSTKNIEGFDIPTELKIELIKLKALKEPLADRRWKKPSCSLYTQVEWNKLYPGHVYSDENKIENYKVDSSIGTYSINTGETKKFDVLGQAFLHSGPYLLKVTGKDKDGKEVKYQKAFTLYKSDANKNPDSKYLWADCSHTKVIPGDTIELVYGTSKDMDIFFEITNKGKLVKSEKIHLNNEQRKIRIPIKESYRGRLNIYLHSAYGNRCYRIGKSVEVLYNNKELDISFKSFRDKLLPGEKESWTITIKDYKNKFVNAEMLATLYDASLDKLGYNTWKFYPFKKFFFMISWKCEGRNIRNWRYGDNIRNIGYKHYSESVVNFFWDEREIILSGMNRAYLTGSIGGRNVELKVKERSSSVDDEIVVAGLAEEAEIGEVAFGSRLKEEIIPITRQDMVPPLPPAAKEVQIRKDFASTAFFYPFLRTDENGNLEIKFTIPESLTRWKMLGMAHTKDLSLGFVEKYLETKKDLMVISNPPRFLREGDRIEFTTKISNLSDKDLSGGVKIELQNAATGEVLDIVEDDIAKIFSVGKNSNRLVSWEINIPENVSLLKYTVVATNSEFSDGESSVIPVLSKRIMVTKSMPFSVKNAGESMLIVPDLKKILKKKTVEPYRMTMEFSSNPIWYAVQSLPYLMEYPYECCEQTFSRYFANKLASHIIQTNPKIKEIYNVWKANAEKGKETFMSKLSKNKELKQIILEETPWVAEAKSQEERIKRLSMLFDLNNMSMEEKRTYDKLMQHQNSDGGWPWFKDMRSNRFITQHILTGLGYLNKITGQTDNGTSINRALKWCKEEFVSSYIMNYKKDTIKRPLNFIDLHFLYMATHYKKLKFNEEERLIVDFYLNKSQKYWKDASLYQKGLAAIVLYRNGRQDAAREIVASLKEYATKDSYYGMYWKENVGGIYARQAQIEIQSLMIEVFSEVVKDNKSVEDMKIWLLNHKRTNSWESTKATVCAIYSLLSSNGGTFDMDKTLKVSVGDKLVFDASKPGNIVEAGTGYVKRVYQKDDISKKMDKVTINKSDDKLVWGSVYLQYFDDLDKVTESSTGLEIKKQILVERIEDGIVRYEKVNDDTPLSVGDKLKVIMDIKNDFPMEFVHIKDLRASCLEPGFVKSGYAYNNRLFYYISVKDASVNYFIDYLPRGEFSLNYELRVTHKGSFTNGISTIQCMYAPEFQSNTQGDRIEVK